MSRPSQAIKHQIEAQRRRALAREYDPVRRDFEVGVASRMEEEARALLTPSCPLETGLGGEIVPQGEDGLPGLESVLQEPDLLNAEASQQRAHLLERAGALELGIEAAQEVQASNAVEKMLAHQMAAAHRRALVLLAESEKANDPQVSCLKAKTAVRLMDAFARSVLVLQRLQTCAGQSIQVQNVQVNGQALIGQMRRG